MPAPIIKSIMNRYHLEAKNDIFKIIGLHVFIVLGLVAGLVMLVLDLAGISPDECLQGDITIILIFGIALYILRFIRYQLAIQVFFFVPVIAFFFFISGSIAIIPNHLSVPYTVWTLIPFFLFFLLFSDNKRDISVYFVILLVAIWLHAYLAGLSDLVFQLKWVSESEYLNPFLTVTLFYLGTLLVAWNFQSTIIRLSEEKEKGERVSIRDKVL